MNHKKNNTFRCFLSDSDRCPWFYIPAVWAELFSWYFLSWNRFIPPCLFSSRVFALMKRWKMSPSQTLQAEKGQIRCILHQIDSWGLNLMPGRASVQQRLKPPKQASHPLSIARAWQLILGIGSDGAVWIYPYSALCIFYVWGTLFLESFVRMELCWPNFCCFLEQRGFLSRSSALFRSCHDL